jgi:hypothetical protein
MNTFHLPSHLAVSASYFIEDDEFGGMEMQLTLWLPCDYDFVTLALKSPQHLADLEKNDSRDVWLKFKKTYVVRDGLFAYVFVGGLEEHPSDAFTLHFDDFCRAMAPVTYHERTLKGTFHHG